MKYLLKTAGYFFQIIIFFLLITKSVFAQSSLVINEFSSAVSNSDWVELYNNSDSFINLSDYSLSDGSTNTKNFSCILTPYGFYTADWNNTLNNTGDIIYLKKIDEVVDCVSYGDGAGNKCEGKDTTDLEKLTADESGARTVDGGSLWDKTTNITKDGPNDGSQKNSEAICLTPSATPTPSPIPTITPSPTLYVQPTVTPYLPSPTVSLSATPVEYKNIYINEVMVNPAQNEKEWVEIFNGNDFSVTLVDWFIDDIENAGSNPKKFTLTISAKGYSVINIPSAIFNNDKDSVRLLDFNLEERDGFEYEKSVSGLSFGLTPVDRFDYCYQQPSPGQVNNECFFPSPTIFSLTVQQEVSPYSTPTSSSLHSTGTVVISSLPADYILLPTVSVKKIISKEEVLGISSDLQSGYRLLAHHLSLTSLLYSLLTMASVLFKMTFIYGKGCKFLIPSFRSS